MIVTIQGIRTPCTIPVLEAGIRDGHIFSAQFGNLRRQPKKHATVVADLGGKVEWKRTDRLGHIEVTHFEQPAVVSDLLHAQAQGRVVRELLGVVLSSLPVVLFKGVPII
jgi:hypothetical protein